MKTKLLKSLLLKTTLDFFPFIFSHKQSSVIAPDEWEILIHGMIDVFSSFIHYQKYKISIDHFVNRARFLSQSVYYGFEFLKNKIDNQSAPIKGVEIKNLLNRLGHTSPATRYVYSKILLYNGRSILR